MMMMFTEGFTTPENVEVYCSRTQLSRSAAKSKCCWSIWQRKGPGTKSISVIAKVARYKIISVAFSFTDMRPELIPIPGFVPAQFCTV